MPPSLPHSPQSPLSCSDIKIACCITLLNFFNLELYSVFLWFSISAGIVIAATTPMIPSVIKTSANVNAILRELFQWVTCVMSPKTLAIKPLRRGGGCCCNIFLHNNTPFFFVQFYLIILKFHLTY